jgi:hypothetical protein
MTFILSGDGRDDAFPGVRDAFDRYRKYLEQNKAVFPPRAYELAAADWFYDPADRRCPHDAWLENLTISESGERRASQRMCSISVRLLGAYHDRYIEIVYPRVFAYSLSSFVLGTATSHGDWRFDEFRLSERGHLIHEIEWAGAPGSQVKSFSWCIESDDVQFNWLPMNDGR